MLLLNKTVSRSTELKLHSYVIFKMAACLSKTLKPRIAFLLIPGRRIPTQTPTPFLSPISSFERTLSSSSSETQDKQSGRWTRWLLFVPGAITFGLGTWQIIRRQEKIEMIDYRRKRLELEPIEWNSTFSSGADLGSLEFRRVVCEGFFDDSKSIFVGPRSRSISGVTENGYYLITPLMPIANKPDSGQLPVLVNRGWVPRSWRDKSLEISRDGEKPQNIASADVGGNEGSSWWRFWSRKPKVTKDQAPSIAPVQVTGVVRGSEKPSIFVPANDPSSGQWFYVDVPAIASVAGLPENTLYIEDINDDTNASQPYPLPKDVTTLIRHSVMPQDHLNYTLTWYTLSAAVTFMAVKRLKPKKSLR